MLRTVKYGDSKMIVETLTEEAGRMSFMCRLPKTPKGKLKVQFFQPLSLLDMDADYRPNRKLQTLRDVRSECPYQSIPFDAVKMSLVFFLAEFLTYTTRSEQRDEALFSYIHRSLEWLDATEGPIANFHLVFMIRLTRFVGFLPNLEDYRQGDYFDLREGCFSVLHPMHNDVLEPREAASLQLLSRINYETMRFFAFTRKERERIVEVLLQYYRIHIPDFPEMKSLGVLKSLFQ